MITLAGDVFLVVFALVMLTWVSCRPYRGSSTPPEEGGDDGD